MPRCPWKLSEHPLPGLTVFSFLSVLQLTYLPPPWGECRSSEMGLDFFPVYSITACRIDCETRYIVENCNCRMVHMPGGWQGPRTSAVSHPDRKHLTAIVLGGLWYLTTKRQIDKLHPSIHPSGQHPDMQGCPYVCIPSVPMLHMLVSCLFLLPPEFNIQIMGHS